MRATLGASAHFPLRQGSNLRQILFEAIEGAGPAALMPVALFDGFEHGLAEGHRRLALMLGERHRDRGFMAGTAVRVLPGEGPDQALRFHHLAIDAALPQLLPRLVPAQTRAPGAAGPQLALEMGGG